MSSSRYKIPVIDLFAGPGGLSEGFSRYQQYHEAEIGFENRLSIEMDPVACETLRLRSFYRSFSSGAAPEDYYKFLRGEIELKALEKHEKWAAARDHVWEAELGSVSEELLHNTITKRLDGAKDWVLLGGPPCQAYSLIGRARMTGLGAIDPKIDETAEAFEERKSEGRKHKLKNFMADARHTLYREYLRIVAVHQPTLFVMENVKGILTSKTEVSEGVYRSVFEDIRKDLSDPWASLAKDDEYETLVEFHRGRKRGYKIHSFVTWGSGPPELLKNPDFVIRSEDYGVPQKRHRVILLGVRDDVGVAPGFLTQKDEVTVSDVLTGMPLLRSGLSKGQDSAANWQAAISKGITDKVLEEVSSQKCRKLMEEVASRNDVKLNRGTGFVEVSANKHEATGSLEDWLQDSNLGGVIQHETRGHMPSDLGRYLYVSSMAAAGEGSPTLEGWPWDLLPDHKNVVKDEETGKVRVAGFKDRFKVQRWDAPASTVTSHIRKDGHYFIHPDPAQCRSLTVREAARLQTFPDNYYFCGGQTQQYKQVGNAVPPYLALQLADVISRLMQEHLETSDG